MRHPSAGKGTFVVGDPCIVWDEEADTWRMFLFLTPSGNGEAVWTGAASNDWASWRILGPLRFTNPEALLGGGTHKPCVVMDSFRPNHAARIDGKYCLLGVSHEGESKVVQRAWADRLAGPWTLEPYPLISHGGLGDFDEKHADAVSALWFQDRGEAVCFYMGYPATAQKWPNSPFGNASGAALWRPGEKTARKLGPVLPPSPRSVHWASGWIGGLEVLPGAGGKWIGLANASPTPPRPDDRAESREEPPPSLGGFATTDALFPVEGWRWEPAPIERIEDIPAEAVVWGEGVNLWRHHILLAPGQPPLLFYNSGSYGREQLFGRMGEF